VNDQGFLATEYSALNDWRNNKVDYQATWGAILVPVALVFYGGGFVSSNGNGWVIGVSWLGECVLLLFYRLVIMETDLGILKTAYPRMVEIEEQCGGTFTRLFLKKAGWWPEKRDARDWLPTREDVQKVVREYEQQTLLGRLFRPVTQGRLQEQLSMMSLVIILLSGLVSLIAAWCPRIFFDMARTCICK